MLDKVLALTLLLTCLYEKKELMETQRVKMEMRKQRNVIDIIRSTQSLRYINFARRRCNELTDDFRNSCQAEEIDLRVDMDLAEKICADISSEVSQRNSDKVVLLKFDEVTDQEVEFYDSFLTSILGSNKVYKKATMCLFRRIEEAEENEKPVYQIVYLLQDPLKSINRRVTNTQNEKTAYRTIDLLQDPSTEMKTRSSELSGPLLNSDFHSRNFVKANATSFNRRTNSFSSFPRASTSSGKSTNTPPHLYESSINSNKSCASPQPSRNSYKSASLSLSNLSGIRNSQSSVSSQDVSLKSVDSNSIKRKATKYDKSSPDLSSRSGPRASLTRNLSKGDGINKEPNNSSTKKSGNVSKGKGIDTGKMPVNSQSTKLSPPTSKKTKQSKSDGIVKLQRDNINSSSRKEKPESSKSDGMEKLELYQKISNNQESKNKNSKSSVPYFAVESPDLRPIILNGTNGNNGRSMILDKPNGNNGNIIIPQPHKHKTKFSDYLTPCIKTPTYEPDWTKTQRLLTNSSTTGEAVPKEKKQERMTVTEVVAQKEKKQADMTAAEALTQKGKKQERTTATEIEAQKVKKQADMTAAEVLTQKGMKQKDKRQTAKVYIVVKQPTFFPILAGYAEILDVNGQKKVIFH